MRNRRYLKPVVEKTLWAVTLFMIICTIATIFSGYEYLKGGKDLLKDC